MAYSIIIFWFLVLDFKVLVNGTPKRLNVCTSCLKANKMTRNI